MPVISVGDGALYYETHGDGYPVFLIPGLGGAAASWRPQVEPFAQHFRVILHDHRGTGQSERSRITYSVDQMAADVVHLMDALEIPQAHLVGISTGGAIAQTLAIDHRDRVGRLALVSTWPKADPFFRYTLGMRKHILEQLGPAEHLRTTPFFLYPDWWINENWEALEASMEAGLADFPGVEIMASRIIDAILAFDRASELGGIQLRTLVLTARNDILTPPYFAEDLARRIPGARLEIIERGAHVCNQTVPEAFNDIVLPFLTAA